MTVISTKCPILNKPFKNESIHSTPDLEVLVRYEGYKDTGNEKVTGIICHYYIQNVRTCTLRQDHGECDYLEGFQEIKR